MGPTARCARRRPAGRRGRQRRRAVELPCRPRWLAYGGLAASAVMQPRESNLARRITSTGAGGAAASRVRQRRRLFLQHALRSGLPPLVPCGLCLSSCAFARALLVSPYSTRPALAQAGLCTVRGPRFYSPPRGQSARLRSRASARLCTAPPPGALHRWLQKQTQARLARSSGPVQRSVLHRHPLSPPPLHECLPRTAPERWSRGPEPSVHTSSELSLVPLALAPARRRPTHRPVPFAASRVGFYAGVSYHSISSLDQHQPFATRRLSIPLPFAS
jgi:hypothetical protein